MKKIFGIALVLLSTVVNAQNHASALLDDISKILLSEIKTKYSEKVEGQKYKFHEFQNIGGERTYEMSMSITDMTSLLEVYEQNKSVSYFMIAVEIKTKKASVSNYIIYEYNILGGMIKTYESSSVP